MLGQWTSWGAVPHIFEEFRDDWDTERAELKTLFSAEEYGQASATTVNAHYTDPRIVDAMWASLEGAGFTGGLVLEPGCGSGTFVGSAPAETDMVGVELDSTSAAIASLLYPNAQIRAEGLEASSFTDGSVSAVVGNVPFGDYVVHDPRYNASRLSIHNYFIAKSLRVCAPGGYVTVLTSTFSMDAQSEKARREIAKYGDLVAAVRLPNNAFREVAGTEAAADVLVFRRRKPDEKPDADRINEWARTGTTVATHRQSGEAVETSIGGWFATRPSAVLATVTIGQGMYNDHMIGFAARHEGGSSLAAELKTELDAQLEEAAEIGLSYEPNVVAAVEPFVPGLQYGTATGEAVTGHVRSAGTKFEQYNASRTWTPVRIKSSDRREAAMLLTLRDAAKAVIESQRTGASQEDRERARAELNTGYDRYIEQYGPLNRFTMTDAKPRTAAFIKSSMGTHERQWRATLPVDGDIEPRDVPVPGELEAEWRGKASLPAEPKKHQDHLLVLRGDPNRGLLLSIEDFVEDTQEATKRAIFTEEVISLRQRPVTAASTEDALRISLDESRRVDLDRIGSLLNVEPTQARDALGVLVFDDPETDTLVPAVQYLSGNVRGKLERAREAAAGDDLYAVNVEALTGAQPEDITAMDIIAKPGVRYVEGFDYEAFIAETFGVAASVEVSPTDGTWEVRTVNRAVFSPEVRYEFATPDRHPLQLMQAMMNSRTVTVRRTIEGSDGSTKQVKDTKATLEARDKAGRIASAFGDWIFSDAGRAERVVAEYNRMFNSNVAADYAGLGEGLSLPGLSPDIRPHAYQRAAVARVLNEPTVLLDHVVGAGKTGSMVMSAMELRRTGIARKPAIVVPNHLVDQVSRDFLQWYPSARVLTIPTGINESERAFWAASAATGDWDAVVMPATVFSNIGIDPIRTQEWVSEQIHGLRATRAGFGADDKARIKAVEKAIKRLEERHERIVTGKTPGVTFEETGIDYLFVDEAHQYKNLFRQSDSYELACAGSDRAADLDYKLRALRETKVEEAIRGGYYTPSYLPAVATFATGTPVANSLSEMWVMQHYLRPDLLDRAGLKDVGSWATQFTERSTVLRVSPAGGGFDQVERINKYINVPELITLTSQFADVVTVADITADLPSLAGGERALIKRDPSEAVVDYVRDLGERAKNLSAVDPTEDNMPKITNDGRMVALDPRLKDLEADLDGGRAAQVATEVFTLHEQHKDSRYRDSSGDWSPTPGALQLLFCDRAVPNDGGRFSMYDAIRDQLIELGMDRERIAFIHDAKSDHGRAELFTRCRDGRVNVLIGSTERMGTGTNVQARAAAIHHVDVPWRPADLEQREGRALRQGNQNPQVSIRSYATSETFDVYMWDMVSRKAKFINQLKSGNVQSRTVEDGFGDLELSAGAAAAALSGDPRLEKLSSLQLEESRLASLHHSHVDSRRRTRGEMALATSALETLSTELPALRVAESALHTTSGDAFSMTLNGAQTRSRSDAATILKRLVTEKIVPLPSNAGPYQILGSVAGLAIHGRYNTGKLDLRLGEAAAATVRTPWDQFLTNDGGGLIRRLENTAANIPELAQTLQQRETALQSTIPQLKTTLELPFSHDQELRAVRQDIEDLMQEMGLENKADDSVVADATVGPAILDLAAGTDRKLLARRLRRGDIVTGLAGHRQALFRAEPVLDSDQVELVAVADSDDQSEHIKVNSYEEVQLVSRLEASLTPFERNVVGMGDDDALAQHDNAVSTGERITLERRATPASGGEVILVTGVVDVADGVWGITDDSGSVTEFPYSSWGTQGPVIRHNVVSETVEAASVPITIQPIVGDVLIRDVENIGQAGDVYLNRDHRQLNWYNPDTGETPQRYPVGHPPESSVQRGRLLTVSETTSLFPEGFGDEVSTLRAGDVVSAHKIDRNQARKDNVSIRTVGFGTMRDVEYLFEDGTLGRCRRRADQQVIIHARRFGALNDHERARLQAPGRVEQIQGAQLSNSAAGQWILTAATAGATPNWAAQGSQLGRLVEVSTVAPDYPRADSVTVVVLEAPDGQRKTFSTYSSRELLIWEGDLPETPLDFTGMDLPSLPITAEPMPAPESEAVVVPESRRFLDETADMEHTDRDKPAADNVSGTSTSAVDGKPSLSRPRPVLHHSAEATSVTEVGRDATDLHRMLKEQGFKYSSRQELWFLNSTWKPDTRDQRAAAFLSMARTDNITIDIVDGGPIRRMALLQAGDHVVITPETARIMGVGDFGDGTWVTEFPPMIGQVSDHADRPGARTPVTVDLAGTTRQLSISHPSGALVVARADEAQTVLLDPESVPKAVAYLDHKVGKPVTALQPGDRTNVSGKVLSLRNLGAFGTTRIDDAVVLANEKGALPSQRYLLVEANAKRAWIEARADDSVPVTAHTPVSESGYRVPRFTISRVQDLPLGTEVSMTGVDARRERSYIRNIITAAGTLTSLERVDNMDRATITTAKGAVTILNEHDSSPFEATTLALGTTETNRTTGNPSEPKREIAPTGSSLDETTLVSTPVHDPQIGL